MCHHHDHQPEPNGVRPAQAAEVPEALLRSHLLLPLSDTQVLLSQEYCQQIAQIKIEI